jgi:hypothetical protein
MLHNRTELVLGQTNIFLCTVEFSQSSFFQIPSSAWEIDNAGVTPIHEEPFCYLVSAVSVCVCVGGGGAED